MVGFIPMAEKTLVKSFFGVRGRKVKPYLSSRTNPAVRRLNAGFYDGELVRFRCKKHLPMLYF